MALESEAGAAGHCDARFGEVRAEFERGFADRDEIGASVAVFHEGRLVVDLWGGWRDAARTKPWQENTIVVVFSCTKGATALCCHMLATARELDLDTPVAHYWPGFERHGKHEITVRMALNHQAGVPGITAMLPPDGVRDFDGMVELVAREEPLWRPGAAFGYHATTFGWLLGEVVRRVSGESVGAFFRRHVGEPIGVDFWIGLPSSEEPRVAETIMYDLGAAGLSSRLAEALANGEPIQRAAINSMGDLLRPGACDAPGAHAAEIPAAGGLANARALARLYGKLALDYGAVDHALVDREQLIQMIATESALGEDAVTFEPARFSAGFEKAAVGRYSLLRGTGLLMSEDAFGVSGLGGSVGFADPRCQLGFGYAMNRHPKPGEALNARYQPLIDAVYRSMGYTSRDGGKWIAAPG